MLIQQETRSIPVHVIDLGNRRQLPSPTEVNQMVSSIKEDGLLAPIGVQRTGENSYHLVHGATRLLAVKELGWLEVPAIIFDGTAEDSASAEIVENLTRRHLDKDQRDELTRAYVALRAEQKQNDPAKEFNDSSSPISCDAPNTHPKTNTEGRKRGRPPTPRGQSKKEVAAATGQSLRNVQRVTSAKPKSGSAPSKTSADRDTIRLEGRAKIECHMKEIMKLFSSSGFNDSDRQQIRQQNQPCMDGFIAEDGKLRFKPAGLADKGATTS